jgi:hypothetical protein
MRASTTTSAFRPAGFGSINVHTSRSTGRLTGVQAGRSGSFGRASGSMSG